MLNSTDVGRWRCQARVQFLGLWGLVDPAECKGKDVSVHRYNCQVKVRMNIDDHQLEARSEVIVVMLQTFFSLFFGQSFKKTAGVMLWK